MVTGADRGRSDPDGGRRALAGLLLLVATVLAAAPAVAVTCSARIDRARVVPGEQVVLTLTIEGALHTLPSPQPPTIEGVDVMAGGSSQSMSVVPGRVSSRLELTWYLTVRRADSFTIPPFVLEIDGASYRTQPIPVEVTAGGQAPPPAGGGAGPAPAAAPRGAPDAGATLPSGRPGDPLFVTLTVDRERAWIGQQIVLTFRFHRGVPLWDSPQYRAPRSEGFWREDLPPERSYTQVIGGSRYEITEIRYALFPTRAGRLTIEPAEVTVPPDPFARLDRLFGGSRRPDRAHVLRTRQVVIDVRSLPAPVPADFSGLVAGRVSLEAELGPREIARGEPVTLRVALRADGFLKGFGGIPLPALPDAEVHDAGETLEVDKSGERLFSRMVIEKVLVPRREGALTVSPVTLTYFDPAPGRYVTVRTEPGAVRVAPGAPGSESLPTDPLIASPLERLARDLAFVHPAGTKLRRVRPPLVASLWWWGCALLPLALLGGLRLRLERRALAARDPASWRRGRAWAVARRALRESSRAAPPAAALAGVGRAVLAYVGDLTDRAPATLGAADVRAYAAALGRDRTGEALASLLEACDEARFGAASAPGPAPPGAADAAARARALLDDLERARRGQGGGRGPVAGALLLAAVLSGLAPGAGHGAAAPDARDAQSPEQRVAEGNAAYTRGDYAAAAAAYEDALASGADDAVAHYNLGNARARQGELGHAVLAYLRALRLDPRNGDARANLAFVRAQMRDRGLQDATLPPVVAQLSGLIGLVSLDEWSLLLLGLLWATAAVVALIWVRGGAGDLLRRSLVALCVGVGLAGGIVGWRYWSERVREQAAIVVPEAEVRSGPAESFPVLFRVHDGLLLGVRGREDGWVRIGLGGEWVGWTQASAVEGVRRP